MLPDRSTSLFCLLVVVWCFIPAMLFAAQRDELVHRVDRSETFVKELMKSRDTSIPSAIWRNAKGILVFRQYKFGFIFGVKGGYGIALVRDLKTGEWSPPAFYRTGEGSFGFQVGGEAVDSVFLIMHENALNMLVKSEFKIGGDVSAAAGPVGRQAEAKLGQTAPVYAYSKAEGLYAGATIEGGVLMADQEANRTFYGKKSLKSREILFENAVEMPPEAQSLVKLLSKYSNQTRTNGQNSLYDSFRFWR